MLCIGRECICKVLVFKFIRVSRSSSKDGNKGWRLPLFSHLRLLLMARRSCLRLNFNACCCLLYAFRCCFSVKGYLGQGLPQSVAFGPSLATFSSRVVILRYKCACRSAAEYFVVTAAHGHFIQIFYIVSHQHFTPQYPP